MRRTMNLCLVGGTLTVFLCWSLEMAESCVDTLLPHLRERAVCLERMRAEIDSFRPQLTIALGNIADGHASLGAASRALEEYTAQHYPRCFVNLALVDPDRSMHAKLARMLVREFIDPAGDVEVPTITPGRRAALLREYEEIVAAETRTN